MHETKMLRELIETFQDRVDLPIEIDEIRDAIIALGFQDKIILSAEDLDTGVLKGAYYQWREQRGVYGEPVWTSLVVYPEGESIENQRLICAKELIHICDRSVVKARSPDAVLDLAKKLVGPFEAPNGDFADIMAATDKLAQYQSMNLLFPIAARKLARERIENGMADLARIADWAVLPETSIAMLLDEAWDDVSEVMIAIGNGEPF